MEIRSAQQLAGDDPLAKGFDTDRVPRELGLLTAGPAGGGRGVPLRAGAPVGAAEETGSR
ncbi:hypothetical protein ACFXG6_07915 [Streptomyces roseus]|uniref:hypothetical protein n=1 Tax=Streptomyces roseus TaxID=66430 RepID=UPI0036CF913B